MKKTEETGKTPAGGRLYRAFGKRALDLLFALLLLPPAALLVLPSMAIVKAQSPGSALFIQRRPGRGGKPFLLFKLRTMISRTEKDGRPLSDMERVTGFGRFIRALSIDELPQLLNILKGDMSFIGPRPLLMQYLPLYTPAQARRHEVRPGISGWAQVNGRNALSWDEKFALDVWYVDHLSLRLDLKIIGMTIRRVLNREGINADEGVTMRPFTGGGGQAGHG